MRTVLTILATLLAIAVLTTLLVWTLRTRETGPGPGRLDVEHSQPMPWPTVPSPAPAGPPPGPGRHVPGRQGPGEVLH